MNSSDYAIQNSLYPALGRVVSRDGTIVGAAFLVTQDELLTCAHVVNLALGLSPGAPERPDEHVGVSLLSDSTAIPIPATDVHWVLMAAGLGDIAVLHLTARVPIDAGPALVVQPNTLFQHRYWCLGFPVGYSMGQQSTGRMLRRLSNGWVQLEDIKTEGPQVD